MLGAVGRFAPFAASAFTRALAALTTAGAWRSALGIVSPATSGSSELIDLLHVDYDTGHRDLIADGWMPAFFNQQWGGAPHYFEMVDGATGVPYRIEGATSYVEANSSYGVGLAAGQYYITSGFKVSQSFTPTEIWLPLYKIGNPTDNFTLQIWSDNAGAPNAALGSAGTLAGQRIQSGSASAYSWYRITGSFPALTAGTQYHLVASKSGGVDVSNYYGWICQNPKKYPYGYVNTGTSAPVWTPQTGVAQCFIIPHISSNASLQTGGTFSDGKLQFFEGSPLNQSNGRVKNLRDFKGLDLTDFTLLIRGTAWTKDKTVLDIGYGMDHDRIVLRSAVTTGYPTLTVYESDGTVHTVTGTTDVSTGDHDIAIRVRAKNDGSDAVQLWVAGASQGTPVSSASIAFDTLFGAAQIGTAWIGGGFALAPTWSGSSISTFSGLPSTLGWPYTGDATESSAFSVSGGKLYQNKNGYGSTQYGYYTKSSLGWTNANGSATNYKACVASNTNTKDATSPECYVADGSYATRAILKEYYLQSQAVSGAYPQMDNKSADSVVLHITKLNDAYSFVNHRLVADRTGANSSADATARIMFGDNDSAAGENSDVVWSYMKYYTTAWLPPQFTSGSLSEFAIWNGDKTAILAALYNSGTEISVKQYCGVQKNYVGDGVVQNYNQSSITANPTTTSATAVLMADMECFAVGDVFEGQCDGIFSNTAIGAASYLYLRADGAEFEAGFSYGVSQRGGHHYANGAQLSASCGPRIKTLLFGLHKFEGRFSSDGANTCSSIFRRLAVKAYVGGVK